jgi:hypothetical protein
MYMRHTATSPYFCLEKHKNPGVELLHFSHFHHFSLVLWTNRLLPATGGSGLRLGVKPTLYNWHYLLELSHYSGDPNIIPDHQP